MKWRAWTIAVIVLIGGVGGLACDDKDDALSPEAIEARRRAQQLEERNKLATSKPAPTTQQLLNGPKTTLRLGTLPLTLDVPAGWALTSSGDAISVSGPASSGEISINLSSVPTPIPANGIDVVFTRAKQETEAKPHPINRIERRDLGAAKVIEQRMISSADFRGGKLPTEVWEDVEVAPGRKVRMVANPTLLKWHFSVFVPTDKDRFVLRTLSFLSLKLSEYEQDREFLEALMKSLKYEE
jgi:hypothetical protein